MIAIAPLALRKYVKSGNAEAYTAFKHRRVLQQLPLPLWLGPSVNQLHFGWTCVVVRALAFIGFNSRHRKGIGDHQLQLGGTRRSGQRGTTKTRRA